MMNKIYGMAIVAMFVFSLTSCGEYSKIIKGRDYEKQYHLALEYYERGKNTKALALLQNVNTIFGNTERADTIRYYYSDLLFREGEYELSADFFDQFRKSYGRSSFVNNAEYMYALSFYMLSPNEERDQLNSARAISALSEYVSRYPNDEKAEYAEDLIVELRNKIYMKEFKVGETYYNIGYYTSALTTFKNILKRTPDIPQREEIRYLMLKANYDYAKKSVKAMQKDRFYDVEDAYYSLVSEFPDTKYKRVATRLFDNARAVIEGSADIDELTVDVKHNKGDIYAERSKLHKRILDLEISNPKSRSLKKLNKKLDELDKEIEEEDNKKAAEEASVIE